MKCAGLQIRKSPPITGLEYATKPHVDHAAARPWMICAAVKVVVVPAVIEIQVVEIKPRVCARSLKNGGTMPTSTAVAVLRQERKMQTQVEKTANLHIKIWYSRLEVHL